MGKRNVITTLASRLSSISRTQERADAVVRVCEPSVPVVTRAAGQETPAGGSQARCPVCGQQHRRQGVHTCAVACMYPQSHASRETK